MLAFYNNRSGIVNQAARAFITNCGVSLCNMAIDKHIAFNTLQFRFYINPMKFCADILPCGRSKNIAF